ncbi:cupin domain-containing protein [Synergistaceae bacterium OttesenSCG-928-D05]|nr:cupin domain-containing protein [Synergistaceae bacterium OttesenSCG-928-D05]
MSYIRHLPIEKAFELGDEVAYLPGQVVSKTVAQNEALSITIFAFDKEEEISTHASHGDALVMVLDGKARITIDGKAYVVEAGQSILMPAGKPHALFALESFKMMLTVVFPEEKRAKK